MMSNSFRHIATFEDCIDHISGLMRGEGIAEARRISTPLGDTSIDEVFLQHVWFDRHLQEDKLKTLSGKAVRILSPGRWNTKEGPDFLGAELKIDNAVLKGDVEIHISAQDWRRHSHNTNPDYNSVILHAFLTSSDSEKYDPDYYGSKIERLELYNAIFPDIQTLKKTISTDDYHYESNSIVGKCATVLREQPSEFVEKFLDLAGDKRLEQKVSRFENQLKGETFNQVFYQAIMTAMGHKRSKALFFLLSKRVPLDELIDYSDGYDAPEKIEIIQSSLLNVANLVPPKEEFEQYYDDETMDYINRLNKHWAEFVGYFNDRIIPPTSKWFANVRPVNFPTRRIAGVAYLIVKYCVESSLAGFVHLFSESKHKHDDPKFIKEFIKQIRLMLTVDENEFWSYRYNFGGKKSRNKLKLIGANMAASIAFNSLLPMVVLRARSTDDQALETFCKSVYGRFPKLAQNVVTKFMSYRLFENNEALLNLINSEKRQQAFYYIFNQCCGNNAVTCDSCVYSEA